MTRHVVLCEWSHRSTRTAYPWTYNTHHYPLRWRWQWPRSYIQRWCTCMVPRRNVWTLNCSGGGWRCNSFGQGYMMFWHDHVEKIVYDRMDIGRRAVHISLGRLQRLYWWQGILSAHGMSLAPYFAQVIMAGKKYPIWQDYDAVSQLGLAWSASRGYAFQSGRATSRRKKHPT